MSWMSRTNSWKFEAKCIFAMLESSGLATKRPDPWNSSGSESAAFARARVVSV